MLRVSLLLAGCLVGAPGSVRAADDARAVEAMHAGVQAFRDNRLRLARSLFLDALNSGLSSVKLHYNLGVVEYRLGDYVQAEAHFREALEKGGSDQLLRYNLARCAERMERKQEAARWYGRAMQGEDPRIASLARRARSALLDERRRERSIRVSVNTGFDSAVVGLVDQVTSLPTDNSDLFANLVVQAAIPSDSRWLGRGRWELTGYTLRYDQQRQVNVDSAALGWRALRNTQHQRQWDVGVYIAHEWLDGKGYQLRGGPEVELSQSWHGVLLRHGLNMEFLRARNDDFSGISGIRLDLGTAALSKLFSGVGMLRLGVEVNDREDEANSPLRYNAQIFWRSPQAGGWRLGPGLQWRWSEYSDGRADEQRLRALLRLNSPLYVDGDARVELQYENNDSDNARRDYEHFRVTLGLSWSL